MMPDREKLIRALTFCCYDIHDGDCNPDCPYYDACSVGSPVPAVMYDVLALLKEQESRVIELSEISPDIYVWVEDRDDGTLFPLKGGVIDPDGDDYFRFDADFGEDFVYYPTEPFGKRWRVWDKCPTEEQMRDTKWEEESE